MTHVDETQDEYLRVGPAARLLHVSPQTLARWATNGKIHFDVTIGGHRRFPRREIERLRAELQRSAVNGHRHSAVRGGDGT
jgi:excisionase family DNA binding protein